MNNPQYPFLANASLCHDFVGRAVNTWQSLRTSVQTGISLSEESITDFNLIELQCRHPSEIRTQKFSKHRESLVGADWEWWLGSKGFWLGLRVQAKKLDPSALTYPELDKQNENGMQIDLLIQNALTNTPKFIPLYVFYNYWNVDGFDPGWRCQTYPKSNEMMGCSLSYAGDVKEILDRGSKALQDISRVMYPWSCLVCCKGYLTTENGDLPNRAFDFAVGALLGDQGGRDSFSKSRFVVREAPDYVYKIMEGVTLSDEDWGKTDVNRVTVIHESKED